MTDSLVDRLTNRDIARKSLHLMHSTQSNNADVEINWGLNIDTELHPN